MEQNNKKVFIVEDDSAISDIYKMIVENAGFKVEVFNLGQDAIRAVQKAKPGSEEIPDIILLDLILPDINGLEVLKEVKSAQGGKDIKVFILTNQSNVEFKPEDPVQPNKVIIKANTDPTQLVGIIKKELGLV